MEREDAARLRKRVWNGNENVENVKRKAGGENWRATLCDTGQGLIQKHASDRRKSDIIFVPYRYQFNSIRREEDIFVTCITRVKTRQLPAGEFPDVQSAYQLN